MGREAWRTIFCLCGQQKENNISRIRSCLFRVWFVALSDSSSSSDYFSEKKQMLRALREFLKFRSQAAQARDVTLAFERLQRCDLQGFVWELYGFALKT